MARDLDRDLYTVPRAAEALGVSTRTVRRRIADGTLRAMQAGVGGTAPFLIDREELERYRRELTAADVEERIS